MSLVPDPENRQLVNDFLSFTFENPLTIDMKKRRLFIWGHCIFLFGNDDFEKQSVLHLLGTDSAGNVWLIQANHHSSVWNEINGYKSRLREMTEQEIVLAARPYVLGKQPGLPLPPFLQDAPSGLIDSFGLWAMYIGKKYMDGQILYGKTMEKIASGDVIHCILGTKLDRSIWNGRAESQQKAFIVFHDNKVKVHMNSRLPFTKEEIARDWQLGTWSYWLDRKKEIVPRPDTIPLLLPEPVIPQYATVLSHLAAIGWNGKFTSGIDSFRIDIQTNCGIPLSFHIGWTEETTPVRECRHPHQPGFSFIIDFSRFKQQASPGVWLQAYNVMKQLAIWTQYKNTGNEFSIAQPDWTADKARSLQWDGKMARYVDGIESGFTGQCDETLDVKVVFRLIGPLFCKHPTMLT